MSAAERVPVDMLNQLSIKADILQKELDLGKRENIYLRKQNEALEEEMEKLQQVIKNLTEQAEGFDDFLQSVGTSKENIVPQDFVLHLQGNLTEAKKKCTDAEIAFKQLESILADEKANHQRYEDELRQSVDREAQTMARLTAVEQELRSLKLLITSDESLQAVESIRSEYEAEIMKLSETGVIFHH